LQLPEEAEHHQQQDPAYRDFEVRSGLSSYLKLLAKVATQKMNATAEATQPEGKVDEPTASDLAAKKAKAQKMNASAGGIQPECKPEEPTVSALAAKKVKTQKGNAAQDSRSGK